MLEKTLTKIYGKNFNIKDVYLKTALTHSTVAHKNNIESNERFEFLGDSILNYTVSRFLFEKFGAYSEGALTKTRATLVSTSVLAKAALNLGLEKRLKINGIISEKMLANVYEAIITAIYFSLNDEGKNDEILKFIKLTLIDKYINKLADFTDYKTQFQEFAQTEGNVEIKYASEKTEGGFISTLMLNGKLVASGYGKTKKAAEMEAAKKAIKNK